MAFIESGVHRDHWDPISTVCQALNVFIFLRPTTQDSTRLIGHGYPTKSTDVHGKSSDWGRMAGFVPCDAAFDKKSGGGAQPDPRLAPGDDPHHPAVRHVHLTLTDELTGNLFGEYHKIVEIDMSAYRPTEKPQIYRRSGVSTSTRVEAGHARTVDPNIRWCKATSTAGNAARVEFALTRADAGWLVWWAHYPFSDKSEIKLIPLYVFAYEVSGRAQAVTGDYDLWLVAPLAKYAGRWHVAAVSNPSPHGPSAATPYITDLINRLNIACDRQDNPVFRHGAEAQNYGFTQALDENIAVFTPGRGRHLVRRHDLPRALFEVRNRGYLVYTNTRYGERDPMIMNQAAAADHLRQLWALRTQIKSFVEAKADYRELKFGAGPQSQLKPALGKMLVKAAQLEHASKAQPLFAGDAALGNNPLFLIKKFHAEFSSWMRYVDPKMGVFRPADFNMTAATDFSSAQMSLLEVQRQLESLVRGSTIDTGAMGANVEQAMALVDRLVG